jgi:hypothetical protein
MEGLSVADRDALLGRSRMAVAELMDEADTGASFRGLSM